MWVCLGVDVLVLEETGGDYFYLLFTFAPIGGGGIIVVRERTAQKKYRMGLGLVRFDKEQVDVPSKVINV